MRVFYLFRLFLFFIFFDALNTTTSAQNFRLVKDINTSKDGNPYNATYNRLYADPRRYSFAVLNGISYFTADDGEHGNGLWRSDGTEAGTYQVKEGVNPMNITVSNGRLYFIGTGNPGLWTSDGTTDGTLQVVIDRPLRTYDYNPSSLTDFNGKLFFVMSGINYKSQLWKSDGTTQGTVLVKELYDAEWTKALSYIDNLTVIKKKLYFTATNPSLNFRNLLCVSNGEVSGTHVISRDILEPGEINASANVDDTLVHFTGYTVKSDIRSLYVSNGDAGNASIATGFFGYTSKNYYSANLARIGDNIYFSGRTDSSLKAESLYKFDVSQTKGVEPVKIVAGSNGLGTFSSVYNLTSIENSLFFTVYTAQSGNSAFWKLYTSNNDLVLLKDSLAASLPVKANGIIYFVGTDNRYGTELWRTNGTVDGTAMIKDINPISSNSSSPAYITEVNNKVLFAAGDGIHGKELWESAGDLSSTSILKDLNRTTTGSSNPRSLTSFNNKLIFGATTIYPANGHELWITDGTTAGTTLISDTIFTQFLTFSSSVANYNSQMFFFGFSKSGRYGLYRTNGTASGTVIVKEFIKEALQINRVIATDNLIYFYLFRPQDNTWELWRSDGSEANTYAIKTNLYSGNAANIIAVGTDLYFVVPNNHGLWKTNGTINGTILLKTFTNDPSSFLAREGNIYFIATEETTTGVWKSDGTTNGTIKLTSNVNNVSNLTWNKGELFFTANGNPDVYGNVGTELFKTGGTANETILVKDIQEGPAGANISKLESVNGTLYIFRYSSTNGSNELWKSNGDTGSTQRVSVIENAGLGQVGSCQGKFFFVLGANLWESDGTEIGTHTVQDSIFPNVSMIYAFNLSTINNQFFFSGTSYQYGTELYAGYISKPGVTNYFSRTDGNWNDPGTWVGNVVPPEGSGVIIRHTITGNINTTCAELRIEEPGKLTINPGFSVQLMQ